MNTDPKFWTKQIKIQTSHLTLLSMHGALCLALRHPDFTGPERAVVVQAVKSMGKRLVEIGALTPDELAEAERLEASEGSGDLS